MLGLWLPLGISASLLSPSPNSFRPAKPSMRTPQAFLSQRPVAFFLLIPTSLPHLIPSVPKHQGLLNIEVRLQY